MKIRDVKLDIVCGFKSKIDNTDLPQVAFAGKSNVGKSSLINALMNRKSLARTSANPGKTVTINYYKVNNEIYFTDLPGYGYAKMSKESREKMGMMVERYLTKSHESIGAVFLLVDIRHEPGNNDKQMYEWVKYNGYEPIIIATKLDKIGRSQIDKSVSTIRKAFKADKSLRVIPFSATTKQGRDEIYGLIGQILLQSANKVSDSEDKAIEEVLE